MMELDSHTKSQSKPWLLIGILVAISAAVGFGAAHWLAGRSTTSTAVSTKQASVSASASANANEEQPEIKIPAEYLTIANVAVEPVLGGGLEAEILSSGTVTAPPNSEAIIVAKASGNVSRIRRQLGDMVRTGDVLALVDSQEATAMIAEKNVANAKLALARKSHAREASLFEQGVTSRQEVEAVQSALMVAEADAKRATAMVQAAHVTEDGRSVMVISPISGTVTAQMASLGSFAQPHTELFRVSAVGSVQVEASVQAADVSRISVGNKATILPVNGMPVAATVRSITPTVSGNSHTATVILTPTTNADSSKTRLVIGEGVQIRLHVQNSSSRMVVPEDAVQNIDGHDVLFVRTKDGFRIQPVLVGNRSNGMAQIVTGIQIGDPVATKNAFLIKADMIKNAKEE